MSDRLTPIDYISGSLLQNQSFVLVDVPVPLSILLLHRRVPLLSGAAGSP
jgi:hypothetical protein